MKFGLAIFSNNKNPSSGMSFLEGVTQSFESIGSLDNSVIWLTNVEYKTWSTKEMWRHANLRNEQFLKFKVNQIFRELGLPINNAKSVALVGEIITRAYHSLQDKYNICASNETYRLHSLIKDIIVPENISNFGLNPSGDVLFASENALQSLQGSSRGRRNASLIHYTFPRNSFYRYLLNLPYPMDSKWLPLNFGNEAIIAGRKNGKVIEGTDQVIKGLKKFHLTKAALLNINVKSISPKFEVGFKFGTEGYQSRTRSWAAIPEVIELMSYAEVEILKGLQTDIGALDFAPIIDSKHLDHDYSKGLVSEVVVGALTEKVSVGNKKYPSGMSIYLRAYDRILCGRLAKSFMENGYQHAGFGSGFVKVWSGGTKSEIDALNVIASQYGAIPDLMEV